MAREPYLTHRYCNLEIGMALCHAAVHSALYLATLTTGATALRNRQDPSELESIVDVVNAERGSTCEPPAPYRQQLINYGDMQYHAEMLLGGQRIQGIIDTGSFELVVFSKGCNTCGIAGIYNELMSSTVAIGNHSQVQSYGSGSCTTTDAWDKVELGCYNTPAQALWLAKECKMPVLSTASFNAVVGVGPPGQPEIMAKKVLEQIQSATDQYKVRGQQVPESLLNSKRRAEVDLKDAQDKRPLLESLGLSTFSHCIGREPGSPAYMVWNDANRIGQQGVMHFGVVGDITWSVVINHVSFHPVRSKSEMQVGCESGCGAILDTGTSLFAVPSSTYRQMMRTLVSNHWTDCSDLSNFPSFVIDIGGNKLHFPPSSYIGVVQGQVSSAMSRYFHVDPISAYSLTSNATVPMCSLLLMDMGEESTEFGPLFILGMPLFREFYTTFHTSRSKFNRSVSIAHADEDCHPKLGATVAGMRERKQSDFMPRVVDASLLRIPHWLEHRNTGSI
mmetsp:Transcript_74932/g.173744  ORF Transcript_74932/g.173744 Transcript_74932/m.173744 type:complete len:505 (+) Transcript_74932:1-1515(+)